MWVISYVSDDKASQELLERAIAWDVAGCPECAKTWQEKHVVPMSCPNCGNREMMWVRWIQMSAQYLNMGTEIGEWTPSRYER